MSRAASHRRHHPRRRPHPRRREPAYAHDYAYEEDVAHADACDDDYGDEPDTLTPYEAAEHQADQQVKVMRDVATFLIAMIVIAIFSRGIAFWVGLFWGWAILRDVGRVFIEPSLRERWIEREVGHKLHHEVRAHRVEVEDAHSRHIEELAAGVAREIRNPITAAKELVQRMGEDPGSDHNVSHANVALEELGRVERSISHLLRFARESELRFEEVELEDVIGSAVAAIHDGARRAGVTIELDIDTPGPLRADRDKLRTVVVNLLSNALDAVADVAEPRIALTAGHDLAGSEVWIKVRDNGPGIPRAEIERIWSPFYSSKAAGQGLGLAVAKKLVEGHGGFIEFNDAAGTGSEFLVVLPRERASAEADRE